MRRILSCLTIAVCSLQTVKAQNYYSASEFGISLGASQYFGDLNDEYGLKYIRPAVAGFTRYHLNPYISLRASLLYTHVGYADNLSSNPYNKKRNLSFQSNIYEASVQAEFNFFRYHTGELNSRFTPYLTGGVGAFYYNPYAFVDDRKYFLRPIGTEGQQAGYDDRKYNKVSVCFPVGAGFKYWLRPGVNLGIEIADRLTLTDHLDDVSTSYIGAENFPNNDPANPNPAFILQDRSVEIDPKSTLGRAGKQRGNSSTRDQYMMVLINLSIQLKVYKCPAYMNETLEYY